jgi:TfoX/Sxy family transcriptional regulator of competence genes
MAWRKAPPELIARFDAVFPADTRAEKRQMFGFPAGFVNGHMFVGLHQESLVLRLADAARHELLKLPGAHVFEPMPGRPMREYVVAPPLVVADDKLLRRWITRALDYASALPAKPKPKARAKAPKPQA